MARPWKHPVSGIYYARKGVPARLRPLIGKSAEKVSLKTRDPEEARRRHPAAMLDIEQRWAALLAGPKELSEREAHELAAPAHDRWIALHRDNPSQSFWQTDLFERLWKPRRVGLWGRADVVHQILHGEFADRGEGEMEEWCLKQADFLIKQKGLQLDQDGRRTLAKAVAAAIQRASLVLERYALGDVPETDSSHRAQPAVRAPLARRPNVRPSLRIDDLVNAWAAERKPTKKTFESWKQVMARLAEFLGHDEVDRITAENIFAWKESLVASNLSAKTIRESKLAPVRAILGWAVDIRLVPENPAERIKIRAKQKPGQGKHGFNESEARIILEAAMTEQDMVKRWVPWICAFTGARLSEVCQLRVEDIVEIEGTSAMRFDADAGSLKNVGSERTVPVHSALIAAGFLDFIGSRKAGPLFPELTPDRFGNRGGNATKVLGRWVRKLGLKDLRLAPSHSWRHRFKTLARNHGLAPDITDAITGHSHRSVGDVYGQYDLKAMKRELEKIPPLTTTEPDASNP